MVHLVVALDNRELIDAMKHRQTLQSAVHDAGVSSPAPPPLAKFWTQAPRPCGTAAASHRRRRRARSVQQLSLDERGLERARAPARGRELREFLRARPPWADRPADPAQDAALPSA